MPEGDTIYRSATTLRKWICGREVTECRTKVPGLDARRLVGLRIEEVTSRGKHLLIGFSNGVTLHTHMKMTGSWHVYSQGDSWQKPQWQAKIVLGCADRLAVCFNAPVVELMLPSDMRRHRGLVELGPDILAPGELDVDEVCRRAGLLGAEREIGEVLLDQRVIAGIGNIYRCEALFLERINPWTEYRELTREQFEAVVNRAQVLMRRNSGEGGDHGRDFAGGGPGNPWVYGRAGRGCRHCAASVQFARLGKAPRDVFWCPRCQPQAGS